MKDFQLRNDTRLLFRNDPSADLKDIANGKRVLYVYGGGSVLKNGCYDDVKNAVLNSGGTLFELGNASRELSVIEKGIQMAKENNINLVIGTGGASVMDAAKLISFGTYHSDGLWDYVKGKKSPYGLEKLQLVLMPTYPSSGSEYGLGAVSADLRTNDFGTAYGIAADYAILVPRYALSLNKEMTAYTGLVTLVQLSASVIGDKNPVSYDAGISVIRNVWKAANKLKENPGNTDAWGVVFYGASISTSGRLGIGKEENYAYDIYELEFIPEVLFGSAYRKSLTILFPRFLKVMAKYHEEDICSYFEDAFGFKGSTVESSEKMIGMFSNLGVDMYFDGKVSEEQIRQISVNSMLAQKEILDIIMNSMR